jgi:hypothetical protein
VPIIVGSVSWIIALFAGAAEAAADSMIVTSAVNIAIDLRFITAPPSSPGALWVPDRSHLTPIDCNAFKAVSLSKTAQIWTVPSGGYGVEVVKKI